MIILTGERQSGKTSLILKLMQHLTRQGCSLSGIVCPGLWQGDQRSGFELLELDTGRKSFLAQRVPGLQPVPFMFDAHSLERGKKALDVSRCQHAEVIIVDELGRLELVGAGWAPCLQSLLDLSRPMQVWVVRKNLLEQIEKHFQLQAAIMDVQDHNCLQTLLTLINQGFRDRHG